MQVFIEDLKTQNILEHNELKEISKFTDANSQLVQKLLRKHIRQAEPWPAAATES